MRHFTPSLILILAVAPSSQVAAQAIALVTRDLNKVQTAARTDSNVEDLIADARQRLAVLPK
jgi:hypothetical protein